MLLGYLWLNKIKVTIAATITGIRKHTICNFYEYFRQLVSNAIDLEDVIIGGNDIIVEIDETKLRKKDGEKGIWVIGGVEHTPERKIFLVEIKERSAALLTHIIKNT
jgi:hypothetical protein